MKVTSVHVKKIDKEGKIRAYATVVLDDSLAIHNIQLVEGEKGMFINFPSKKIKDTFKNIVHPINNEVRSNIQESIINEYNAS